MFQQYTANILPLWNSAGKFCNLKKHLGHLTGVSMDLQTGDQKKKPHKVNTFGLALKEWVMCVMELIAVAQLLSRARPFATPWTAAHRRPCPAPTPEFAQTHVHCD